MAGSSEMVELARMPDMEQAVRKHLRFNLVVNMLDGGFFGLGWGFGSMGTIIPLFVSHMTSSALLIGLIPSIHGVGWQLPQLFMANAVQRLRRYKPMVLLMTIHERLPFLGLALIALFLGALGNKLALVLVFAMLVWQGIGAGFTANAWQSMVAKIVPSDWRGTFFGAQAALSNILMGLGAIAAGYILDRTRAPLNFTWCFLLTVGGLILSYIAVALTREPEDTEKVIPERPPSSWQGGIALLRKDRNFLAYLIIRMVSQFSMMGFAFYIVFGLKQFAMSDLTAGFLTAALTVSSTIANLVMGWLGDRLGHRSMLVAGSAAVTLSSLCAWMAPSVGWLYPAFILSGLASVAYWTIGMAMTVEFGSEETRPTYIGLSNTLVAPFTIIAPLIGGLIAETSGFRTTFMISAIGGAIISGLLLWLVRNPRPRIKVEPASEPAK